MRSRVLTGIEGLDRMLGGGIPQGNQVILAGGPGAGKTLLSMEFLYRNAKQGANSAMISFEESKEGLIQNVKDAFLDFTDIDQQLASGKLSVYDITGVAETLVEPYVETGGAAQMNQSIGVRERTLHTFFKEIEVNLPNLLKKSQAKIIVIDNLTVIRNLMPNEYEYRNFVTDMARILKSQGITSIVIIDLPDPREEKVSFGPEFFAFDGIITLYYSLGEGKKVPLIEVVKMRGTDHSHKAISYKILSSGIKTLNIGMED
jgi:circadian clock protein KaiC